MPIDHLADDVGGLVAVERRMQHLNLQVGLGLGKTAVVPLDRSHRVAGVPVEILERALPAEIENNSPERVPQPRQVG